MATSTTTVPQPYSSAFKAGPEGNGLETNISDLAERRRIQNRIAQRNYRERIKRRLEDLEQKGKVSSLSPEELDTGFAATEAVDTPDQGIEVAEKRQTTQTERDLITIFEKAYKRDVLVQDAIATPLDWRFAQPSNKGKRMWTEITKDLVSEEAIKTAAYEFEETDDFFYIMDYLRYEDVLRLVELSEDLKRVRDESYLPDYKFELNEGVQNSVGSISSGLSTRSCDSVKPPTVSSAPTLRSVSPDRSSLHSPQASSKPIIEDEGVRCEKCGQVFTGSANRTNLFRHYRTFHPSKRLWCPERHCNASFFESSQWEAHLEDAHTSAKKPLCWKHDCNGRQFDTLDTLFAHLRDPRHGCLICGAEFDTENARDRHISYQACSEQSEVPVLQVTRPSRGIRRAILATRMTESLRRNLLWERRYRGTSRPREARQMNTRENDGSFAYKGIKGANEQRRASLLSQESKESCNVEDPMRKTGNNTVTKQRPEGEAHPESAHSSLEKDNQKLTDPTSADGTMAFSDPKIDRSKHCDSIRSLDPVPIDDDNPDIGRTTTRTEEKAGVPSQMLGEHKEYANVLDRQDRIQLESSYGAAVSKREGKRLSGIAMTQELTTVSVPKSSLSNRIKQYIEDSTQESWDWWPLNPCHRSVEPGIVRLQWYCALGHKHATPVSQADAANLGGKVEPLSKQQWSALSPQLQSTASVSTVADSDTGSGSDTIPPSDSHSSSSQSSSATSDGHASDLPDDDPEQDRGHDPDGQGSRPEKDVLLNIIPPSQLKGFVLFGVHGSKRLRRGQIGMAQIDVEVYKDDDRFFEEMAVQYKKLRGYVRWIFSLWCFRTCEFVMYHKANPNDILVGPSELPSPKNADYLFEPHPKPPILEQVFATNFYGCKAGCMKAHLDVLCLLHECHSRNHCGKHRVLERLPRRRRKWEIDRDEETDEAWGLNAVFGISFSKVVVYHILIFAAPVVFCILWIRKVPGDWQNASVPFFAAGVLLSLFWLPFVYRVEEKRGKMKFC